MDNVQNASVLNAVVAQRMAKGETQEAAMAFLNRAITYSYKGRGRLPADIDEINAAKAIVGLPLIPRPAPKAVAAPVQGTPVAQGVPVVQGTPVTLTPRPDPMAALLSTLGVVQGAAAVVAPAPVAPAIDPRLANLLAAGIPQATALAMLAALPAQGAQGVAPVQGTPVATPAAVVPAPVAPQGQQVALKWSTIGAFAKTAKGRVYVSEARTPDGTRMIGIRHAALVPAKNKKGVAPDAKYVMAREADGSCWVLTPNGTALSEPMFRAIAGSLGLK